MAEFTPYEQKLIDELSEKDREVGVLTAERDAALRRVEELEREAKGAREDNEYWRTYQPWSDPQVVVSDWNTSPRGGVNPNA